MVILEQNDIYKSLFCEILAEKNGYHGRFWQVKMVTLSDFGRTKWKFWKILTIKKGLFCKIQAEKMAILEDSSR